MRVIDGINPFDRCFYEAVSRGITCAVICPGSANPCGGQIIAAKTAGRRIDDMLIRTVGVKFALGENPKRVYNGRDEAPVTRMATAAIIREGLAKAKRYLDGIREYESDRENSELPEYDIKCEALLPLLRNETTAYFHCHRADDIFTALRISKEFGIKPVLIHATEGHLIADILGRENVTAIAGPILCDRCKPEMKSLELKNAGALAENGVKTAICTDHTVVPIQYLPLSAAAAVKGGMNCEDALKAITCNAAEAAGIADRTGSIEVGKDADLQLYPKDCDPLDMMSEPVIVAEDGVIVKNIFKSTHI